MKLTTVDSSMIHAVGYDSKTKELEVIFNSGSVYRYTGVPRSEYKNLLAAPSKGQFMGSNVIDVYPDYPVTKRGRR